MNKNATRPRATTSGITVLMLAGWYLVRLIAAWQYRSALRSYLTQVGAFYIAATGLLWFILFSLTAWGAFKPSSRFYAWLTPVYTSWVIWLWLDLFFLQHHQHPGGSNWLLILLLQAFFAINIYGEKHFLNQEGSTSK